MKVDQSKRPAGATHYVVGSMRPWEKRVGDSWFFYNTNGEWSLLRTSPGDGRLCASEFTILELAPEPEVITPEAVAQELEALITRVDRILAGVDRFSKLEEVRGRMPALCVKIRRL